MKKVKLTTVTLALLAGTVVAPIVSVAADLEQQTQSSVQADTKTEGQEDNKSEDSVEKTEDESDSVKPEEETSDKTSAPAAAAPKVETPKTEEKAAQVDPETELSSAIQAARDEAYARHTAGDITYEEYANLDARILACQSVEDVNQMIAYMNNELNSELKAAKEAAIREVDDLHGSLRISTANRDAYVTRIDAAGTQAEIDAVLVEARSEAALFDAKLAAKTEIQGLVDGYGFSNEDSLVFLNQVDAAKSEAEVNAAVANAKEAAALGTMRYEGKVVLNEYLVAGIISTDEYYIYANQIDAATTQAAIDSILASAKEFVDLKEYKKEAYYKLSELVHEEKLSMDDYSEFMGELEAATNKAEVDQVLANAQTRVELNEAKEAAKEEVLKLAHDNKITLDDYWNAVDAIDAATTIEEVNAAVAAANAIAAVSDARIEAIKEIRGLVDGRGFTDEDSLVYIDQLYDANSVEEINAVVEAAKAFADLNGAKVLAYDELYALLNEGKLTEAEYDEFTALVDAATDKAGIESALEAAHERIALKEAKELAKEVILKLAHAELITSGEYWDFVNAIDAATSFEEVNSIVDEANQLATLRQAQKDAKDELFSLMVTGDLNLADYYHFTELVDNAKTAEEVNEIMATVNALVAAREAANNELDGLYDEELLTSDETSGFKERIEDAKTAEEVEAIMVEARELANSRRVEEITESTVTVNYVDENGKSIKDSESLTKDIGESHVFEAATIEGYELQGPSSLELTFTDAPQTVTFTYKKVEEAKKEGNIIVQYLDTDGKELKPSEKLTKEVGTEEVLEAPAIKGYKITGPSALIVTFAEPDQTVAFTYEKVSEEIKGEENKDDNKGESKKSDDKKSDNNKKSKDKKDALPQTGETAANAGLVAGGILSMLSAAFVFLRKGK